MSTNAFSYSFDADRAELDGDPVEVLGGKGHSLALMTEAGLPVPPGFTLTTEACRAFMANGWSAELDQVVGDEVAALERATGKELGSATSPLLVSVRSGAAVSMPGMMDTVLNVGMTAAVEQALAGRSGDPEFAADTHRRFLLGYAEIVLGAPREVLDTTGSNSAPADVATALRTEGYDVPTDPMRQVQESVKAVFESWTGARAARYRAVEEIDESLGTAATVQAMVFGNLGDRSGTGVAFTRNPTTGERGLMGDFLPRAQGEDVVAGTSVTQHLDEVGQRWPDAYAELEQIAGQLEAQYCDMVDIEFTIEQDRLWMLQARRGKRSPIAAFRVAIDMAEDDGFPLDRAGAVRRCRRYFDDPPTVVTGGQQASLPVAATGLAACPGHGSGVLVLDPDRAVELADRGVEVVLARRETSPADVHGMAVARGLFTTLGGLVSHAALVAREWGIPAVVGASEAEVVDGAVVTPGGRIEAGDLVTVDGDNGRLLIGRSAAEGVEAPEVTKVRSWAADVGSAETDPARGGGEETAPAAGADSGSDDDLAFRALHALRIKGMADADTVAALAGTDGETVRPHLDALVDRGAATYMEPRGVWLLGADGREAHGSALEVAVANLELDGMPYDEFMALNGRFKELCTDWQLRDGEPNSHDDADYDANIVARLGELDDEAGPVIDAIGAVVPWMAGYRSRLSAARQRAQAGDPKALTGVMCDSYHDIWMELHEDLILTQGIDRAAEGSF